MFPVIKVFIISFFVVTAFCTAAPTDDAETKRKKAEFLKSPVFKRNLERQREEGIVKPTNREAKIRAERTQNAPRKEESKCGSDSYLKSYCFHSLGNNRWMICADKWNGCITKRDAP